MSDQQGLRVAVLGLGEAGREYARGLSGLGAVVAAYDPAFSGDFPGVLITGGTAEAVAGVDVVLSMVGASAADGVADSAFPALGAGTVFADMNTASPAQKLAMSHRAALSGIPFVDVAIMAPVPRAGIATELLASGTGAERLMGLLGELGIPIQQVPGEAGAAAGLKLIRSVFMKGLAGLVFESLAAADKVGANQLMRGQLASELGPAGDQLVERLIEGTRMHAGRREHEMHDAESYLRSLGSPTWMTQGTLRWLHSLAE